MKMLSIEKELDQKDLRMEEEIAKRREEENLDFEYFKGAYDS